MADIDIQEKKGAAAIWPWIVGLLVLVLLIWAAMEMFGGDDDVALTDPAYEEQPYQPVPGAIDPAGTAAGMPTEVTQFEQQCGGAAGNTAAMSPDHSYISNCVAQMSAALNAVVQRDTVNGTALAPQLDEFRQRADRLTQNAQSLEHSTYVQQVFEGAVSIIASMAQTRGTTASGVQGAANAFSANRPVLEQKDAVHAFFRETATALRSMATN